MMLARIVILMITMKMMVMAELVREGDYTTFECTSSDPQWKFCEWNLTVSEKKIVKKYEF